MEAALHARQEKGSRLALVADPQGRIIAMGPERMDLAELNARLREAGLGSLWKIDETRECVLPMLGAGKVDYRALREQLEKDAG